MKYDSETRILIQQKNEKGEFETVKTNSDIVGVIFDGDKPFALITGSDERMKYAAGAIMGYSIGRYDAMSRTQIVKADDSHA